MKFYLDSHLGATCWIDGSHELVGSEDPVGVRLEILKIWWEIISKCLTRSEAIKFFHRCTVDRKVKGFRQILAKGTLRL
jgi:hypothetical protein